MLALESAADPVVVTPATLNGALYRHENTGRLAADRGWTIAADGAEWRRVVASPEPRRILEDTAIRQLLDAGALVISGGGPPVVQNSSGRLARVGAVVDKDLTAKAITVGMDAERLLLLTDVAAVMRDFGTPRAAAIEVLTLADIAVLQPPAGSMGTVQACNRFPPANGHLATIGALTDAVAVLGRAAGTTTTADATGHPAERGGVAERYGYCGGGSSPDSGHGTSSSSQAHRRLRA